MNQNYRIFIGDRPSLHLNSVQRALTLQYHTCHFAHDFAAATSIIGQETWDVALVNPEVFAAETFALCRALRATNEPDGVEIAFLTDDASDASHWTARALTSVQECVRIRQARLELREQIATTAADAGIDPVTGLCSADRWHKIAKTEAAQAAQHRSPLGLLTMRLKNTDTIFAANGASGVDQAIQQVASVLHAGTRGVDILARGREHDFYLLTPHTDAGQLARIARRLCDAVLRHPLISEKTVFTLEIAYSIASLAAGESDAAPMVARALQEQAEQCCSVSGLGPATGGHASRAA